MKKPSLPAHSITASARKRKDSGIARPIAFAVFRLISKLAPPFAKFLAIGQCIRIGQHERADARHLRLLRVRCERPGRRRAAEEG